MRDLIKAEVRKATLRFLRVSINLTNSSGEACEALNQDLSLSTILTKLVTVDVEQYSHEHIHQEKGDRADISSDEEEELAKTESDFELLLLSLGLMINFIQESEKVKDMILSTELAMDIRTTFETLVHKDVFPSTICLI